MANNGDSYDKWGLVTFLGSVAFCCVFFIYISFFHPSVEVNELAPEPGPGGAPVVVDIASIEKPWTENSDVANHGKKVFKTNCALCHGETGKGDGAAGAALVPKPRDLVEGKWTKGGKSKELFHTISNGIDGTSMAAFKHLSVTDRWALVQFIRSITKNKVAEDATDLDKFAEKAN